MNKFLKTVIRKRLTLSLQQYLQKKIHLNNITIFKAKLSITFSKVCYSNSLKL